jgi:hypothetical protein
VASGVEKKSRMIEFNNAFKTKIEFLEGRKSIKPFDSYPLYAVFILLSFSAVGQNNGTKSEWENILRATDRSSLANNRVASHNPGPHAWENFSETQSAFGKLIIPEIMAIHTGHVYTIASKNSITLNTITNETWLPWMYEGENKNVKILRSMIKDTFGSKISLKKRGKGLLILELNKFTDHYYRNLNETKVSMNHGLRNQMEFKWKNFIIQVSFIGCKEILFSHDPESIVAKFQGSKDTLFNDNSVLHHFERNGEVFGGAIFEDNLEVFITVTENNNKASVLKFEDIVNKSRKEWIQFLEHEIPKVKTKNELIRNAYYFAWVTFWSNRSDGGGGLTPFPYISSSKFMYPTQFYWDESFHSVILSYLKEDLRFQYLKNFAYSQGKDGGMAGSLSITKDHGEYMSWIDKNGTGDMQPPIIGIILPYLKKRNRWPPNLKEFFDVYSKNINWIYSNARDGDQDGILEYTNSYQSGCDNSSRWDGRYLKKDELGPIQPVEAIDLNCWIVNLHVALGEMADSLGLKSISMDHYQKAIGLQNKIEELMWNEDDGIYYDLDARTNEQIKVKSQMAFSALHLPNSRPDRIKRLINEHLINTNEFWTKYPVPSVSIDTESFSETDMWRGPVWININWMIIDGLEKQGYHDIAQQLAYRTISLVGPKYSEKKIVRSARFNEWFNPVTGKPLGNENMSWSCLVIDLIQRFDWSNVPASNEW